MTFVISVLEQGLIYAIMALGVYITYKILDFPDLTVDGTFPLGAAGTVVLISEGVNPWITLPIAFFLGALAGMVTGLIHVKLKVRDLLSGIIMMTALYTVNLRIAGKANFPIYNGETIFSSGFLNDRISGEWAPYVTVLVILMVTVVCKYLLDGYLNTKSGFLLRAVGDNPALLTTLGVDKGIVKILGLSIANGLVALSGCVYAQHQRFFDISIGTGTVVIGLASVIMGISIFRKVRALRVTTSVVMGSILYRGCVALAISIGLESRDLKLVTAVLFLIVLILAMERGRKQVERC